MEIKEDFPCHHKSYYIEHSSLVFFIFDYYSIIHSISFKHYLYFLNYNLRCLRKGMNKIQIHNIHDLVRSQKQHHWLHNNAFIWFIYLIQVDINNNPLILQYFLYLISDRNSFLNNNNFTINVILLIMNNLF